MARETMEATDKLAGITASVLSDASLHVQHSYVYIYILNLCTTCVEWTPQRPFWLPITRPIYNALNDVSRSSACVPSLSLHLSAEVFVWIEPTAVVTGQFVFGRNSCASLGDNKEWNWHKYVLRWGVQNKCTRK